MWNFIREKVFSLTDKKIKKLLIIAIINTSKKTSDGHWDPNQNLANQDSDLIKVKMKTSLSFLIKNLSKTTVKI